MRKWIRFTIPLVLVFVLTSFRYNKTSKISVPKTLKVNGPTEVAYPKQQLLIPLNFIVPPFVGSSYIGFKEALAFKESQGDYFVTNTFGYLGKYQFGVGTLQLMGVYNATQFLNDPKLQEKVFRTNLSRNKWILRRDIARFVGKKVNGFTVTESGILAAAHLAGAGNVKKFLRSYGDCDFSDGYGTKISYYMKRFAGYDVSVVDAVKNPKV